MATPVQLDWLRGHGTPPMTEDPDAQRIFVFYRDVRQPALDYDVLATDEMSVFSAAHGGKYTFLIKSKKGSDFSSGQTVDSYIVDGTLADPGSSTDPIPAGIATIAPPEGLSVGPVA